MQEEAQQKNVRVHTKSKQITPLIRLASPPLTFGTPVQLKRPGRIDRSGRSRGSGNAVSGAAICMRAVNNAVDHNLNTVGRILCYRVL